jgi:hypothetical protein
MLKKSRIFLFFDPKIPNATPFGGRSLTEDAACNCIWHIFIGETELQIDIFHGK